MIAVYYLNSKLVLKLSNTTLTEPSRSNILLEDVCVYACGYK